ncbi:MAG: DUF4440 domain-containing protein [Gammaproteobacteria bacterium]
MKNNLSSTLHRWSMLGGVLALLFLALHAATPVAMPDATAPAALTTGSEANAVADAYHAWLKAVSAADGDPAPMLKFYAPDAILVATYSPVLLHNNNGELAGYFKKFTALPKISGTTQDLQTRVYGNFAINTGLYTFTYETPDSEPVVVPARFTFVYQHVGDKWLIVDHHSSIVPIAL